MPEVKEEIMKYGVQYHICIAEQVENMQDVRKILRKKLHEERVLCVDIN